MIIKLSLNATNIKQNVSVALIAFTCEFFFRIFVLYVIAAPIFANEKLAHNLLKVQLRN